MPARRWQGISNKTATKCVFLQNRCSIKNTFIFRLKQKLIPKTQKHTGKQAALRGYGCNHFPNFSVKFAIAPN